MTGKMKILIAYDGSDCADSALDDLRKAGLPPEAEALVISVAEVWLPPPPPSSYEITGASGEEAQLQPDTQKAYAKQTRAVSEARSLAECAAARLRGNFPGWEIGVEAAYGSPAWEVITRSDSWAPDLIVVGSYGRNAFGRLVLGSVSQKVLTEARCSVRVARGRVEVEGPSPARIIIGVDGSPGSEAAVRAAAARRWPAESEARVVIIEDPLVPTLIGHLIPQLTAWIEESVAGERSWLRKLSERTAGILRSAGLNVSSVVMTGDPKAALVEEAERWRADCIFVGSTGTSSGFERFLLGSVSAAVAARAACSVEVVRQPLPDEPASQEMSKQ